MPPGRKLGGGCWTCRLRRKRCNSVRPVCGSCQNLEITCYSDEARPSWMDGAAGQKHMSEAIKKKIKQNALLRRERRSLTHKDQDIVIVPEADYESRTGVLTLHAINRTNEAVVETALSTDLITSAISTNSVMPTVFQPFFNGFEEPRPSTAISLTSDPALLLTGSSPSISGPSHAAVPIHVQLASMMIYLDYVFPFLFPFYQPPLIETGRQWLLGLLCQNEVSFHIAASLSAYFFLLVPQKNEQDMHDDCKALVRNRLIEQMDMAIMSIQNTVSAVRHPGAQSSLLDKIRVMEEITQLLIVEVTVRTNVDWTIHLTPALALFDEIFKSHGISHLRPNLAVLLSALPSPFPVGTPHHKPLPNTADQSALVFFVSLLLFIDIVASTSLGTSPVLRSYHSLLSAHGNSPSCISLEAVVGCQNWALVAVGDVSALCAWKRDAKQSGNFSVFNIVNLAKPISQALEEGLTSLNDCTTYPQPNNISASWLKGYYSRHDKAIDHASIARITRIWAHAAKIYLSVTLSGWQVQSTDIKASVTKILTLLQDIESPAHLRSLSWPILVAGCLALPSQRYDFRRIVEMMGQLAEFGTICNASRIMEAVWSSRDTIDENTWDIASSLSILGSSPLLL